MMQHFPRAMSSGRPAPHLFRFRRGGNGLLLLLMLCPAPAAAYGPLRQQTCVGIALTPGSRIQRAVESSPPGTIFCLAPGTYPRQTIVPKDYDQFVGLYGAVLDGENAVKHAFEGTATGVVIENLKITRYDPPAQDSPIHGDAGERWIVRNNEISYNGGAGLDLGDHMQAVGNNIHHNLQIGVDMNGFGRRVGHDILLDGNEIAYNNYTTAYDPGWEAGGTKFWNSANLTVSNNYVHDNVGPGLWTDTNNIGTRYIGNDIENNRGPGIHHEVSYDAVIRNNFIKGNGSPVRHQCSGWLWCAGISISSSGGAATTGGGIEIYGNIVVPGENGNGIGLVQNDRTKDFPLYGPHIVQNVYVHDNIVDLSRQPYGGDLNGNGAVSDDNETKIFTSRNNRFAHNTYYLRQRERPFSWLHSQGGVAFWRAAGQDRDGRFFFGSSVYGSDGVTAALAATPSTLPSTGGEVTITWQSSHAVSCRGTKFTPIGSEGVVKMPQHRTTTYVLSCTGRQRSATASATVRVQ